MLRNYYSDLGLEKTAGSEEIKKAYRKLAMMFHPDKNDNPLARQRFNEINQAYHILSDPQKKREYDDAYKAQFMIFQPPVYTSNRGPQTYTYKTVKVKRKPKKLQYSKNTILFALWFNRFSFFFAVVIFLDAILPPREYHVEQYSIIHDEFMFIEGPDFSFPINNFKLLSALPYAESITVYKTAIFSTNLKISASINPEIKLRLADWARETDFEIEARPAFGIYQAFMIMPIILCLFSLPAGFFVKNTTAIVDYSIAILLLDAYTLFFLSY